MVPRDRIELPTRGIQSFLSVEDAELLVSRGLDDGAEVLGDGAAGLGADIRRADRFFS
jgi:hypothetical protein